MDVTKPYEFIGFGAMDVTKPYKFIGFGALDVTKPYVFSDDVWEPLVSPHHVWFGLVTSTIPDLTDSCLGFAIKFPGRKSFTFGSKRPRPATKPIGKNIPRPGQGPEFLSFSMVALHFPIRRSSRFDQCNDPGQASEPTRGH